MAADMIQVEGLSDLQAKLNAIKSTEAARILNRGLRAAGAVFQAEETARAPVRPALPSGTALPVGAMRHDIEVHTRRPRTTGAAAVVAVGPGKYTTHAARWVEFGHRMVRGGYSKLLPNGKGRGPGKETGFVPAHPFLRPAYEAGYQPALEAFRASVVTDVEALGQKGAA